jgi:hypothetical protein
MVHPTQEELNDLSEACSKLWDLDDNRLVAGQDYQLNLQVRDGDTELMSWLGVEASESYVGSRLAVPTR